MSHLGIYWSGMDGLQRIPSFAYVLAIDLVIRRKAPWMLRNARQKNRGDRPSKRFTMDAFPLALSASSASFIPRKGPFVFTASILSNCSSVVASIDLRS